MIRITFILFAISALLSANIDSSIKKNKKILKIKKYKAIKIQDKLEDIAASINRKKKEISDIELKIKQTNEFLAKQKDEYADKLKELQQLQQDITSLNQTKSKTQQEIIDIISKELSVDIVSKQDGMDSIDAVIAGESIKVLSKILQDKFKNIKQKYINTNKKIDAISSKIKELKNYINSMQKKKKLLSQMKLKRVKSIKYLKYRKIAYDKKLNKIFSEQNAIKQTLNRLNILKLKRKKRKKTIQRIKAANINNQKVKKLGNSYQRTKTIRYRGPKTIAPLKSFYVKRKYGEYFDPIYKIKIFNESVTLKSRIKNAKVKNVLNGKVVFAKSTPMLDNVVIIENANGIHTIYAHLSKIAPTIKKGVKIRKGYVIGRVKDELIFEVTQKNAHINPLRLIRF